MTPPKPKPPSGWPFDRHLWEDDVWKDSILNPENWPDHMKPIDVTEDFEKAKGKENYDRPTDQIL